jgi:hypothetical protein
VASKVKVGRIATGLILTSMQNKKFRKDLSVRKFIGDAMRTQFLPVISNEDPVASVLASDASIGPTRLRTAGLVHPTPESQRKVSRPRALRRAIKPVSVSGDGVRDGEFLPTDQTLPGNPSTGLRILAQTRTKATRTDLDLGRLNKEFFVAEFAGSLNKHGSLPREKRSRGRLRAALPSGRGFGRPFLAAQRYYSVAMVS